MHTIVNVMSYHIIIIARVCVVYYCGYCMYIHGRLAYRGREREREREREEEKLDSRQDPTLVWATKYK